MARQTCIESCSTTCRIIAINIEINSTIYCVFGQPYNYNSTLLMNVYESCRSINTWLRVNQIIGQNANNHEPNVDEGYPKIYYRT